MDTFCKPLAAHAVQHSHVSNTSMHMKLVMKHKLLRKSSKIKAL